MASNMAESVKRLRGLPYEATVADIQEWLKDFPVVEHGIDIQVNANGCPMGQAWVEFVSPEIAAAAQTKLHKKNIGSRYIEVLSAQPADLLERGKQRTVLTSSAGPSVVKLRHLPWAADEMQVLKFVGAPHLPVSHATVVRNARGRSTGEAFVQLPEGFDRASIMRKHGSKLDGRAIDITPSNVEEMRVFLATMVDPRSTEQGPRDSVSPHTLWMRGMPFTCTEEDVANFFCGLNIRRQGVSLIQDYYGDLTGEAVVQFETAADLAAAKLREKQFMQNRFIEWQRQPSCNSERLGRIFANSDPSLRLSWEEGDQGQPQEEGYDETYDDSGYPAEPQYGYPTYPPHHQPPPPHGRYGAPSSYYPQPYPQYPPPQSQYPPAYAGGWDQNGYQPSYPPHPQGYAPHSAYPPQPYPGHAPYTNPNAPPPPYSGYPTPYPNTMPPPHYGGYPAYGAGGDYYGEGYWNGQQYDQHAGAWNQERQEPVEGEEGVVGSEGVSEAALSAQSSLEGAKEGTDAAAPKLGGQQNIAQQKDSKVQTHQQPSQHTPPTQYQQKAGGFRGPNQQSNPQYARGGPGQQQRRGGYTRN